MTSPFPKASTASPPPEMSTISQPLQTQGLFNGQNKTP